MEPTQEQKFSSSNIFLTKRADLLPIILFKKPIHNAINPSETRNTELTLLVL